MVLRIRGAGRQRRGVTMCSGKEQTILRLAPWLPKEEGVYIDLILVAIEGTYDVWSHIFQARIGPPVLLC